MGEEKDYRELAIDALKESDICKGYKDYLLAILEITEYQALEELRHAVQVEHEEYEELKRKMKKIKKCLKVMTAQKSIDVAGPVLETGKWICAYNDLQVLLKEM